MSKIFILITAIVVLLPIDVWAIECWYTQDCPENLPKCAGADVTTDSFTGAPVGTKGTCAPAGAKLANGLPCAKPDDCISNFCVNAVCVGGESPTKEKYVPPITPKLQIPIPELKLTEVFTPIQEGEQRVLYIPTIAEYAAGIYRYLIAIVGILAGVMITWAGVKWLMAAGNAEMISDAKHKIGGAIIGIILAVGSYIIMYLINPDLVTFKSLRIPLIAREELHPDDPEEEEYYLPPTVTPPAVVNWVTLTKEAYSEYLATNVKVAQAMQADIIQIAKELKEKTGAKFVGYAERSLESQIQKWKKNCEGRPKCTPATVCNPYGKANTIIDAQGNIQLKSGAVASPANCPHTSGFALDATCTDPQGKYQYLKPYIPCHLVLEQLFQKYGFCRLQEEMWHFEKPVFKCNTNWTPGTYKYANYSNCTYYQHKSSC